MNPRRIILRETLVSVAINAVISAGFFFATFGLPTPIPAEALGLDFLPQSFMVTLMGCLIPSLLVRRQSGQSARPIVLRALLIAVLVLVVAGGGAMLVCMALGGDWAALPALVIKVLFGALLAAIATPVAVAAALRPDRPGIA